MQTMWATDPEDRPTIVEVCDELARCSERRASRSDGGGGGPRANKQSGSGRSNDHTQPPVESRDSSTITAPLNPVSAATSENASRDGPESVAALRDRMVQLRVTMASLDAQRADAQKELERVRQMARELR